MSHIYDNWERLVDAALKRDQIWQLCHCDSIGSSSYVSSDLSSFRSQNEYQNLGHENGVELLLVRFRLSDNNNTTTILQVNFDEVLRSADTIMYGGGPVYDDAVSRLIQRYEYGVYVTTIVNQSLRNEIERVRFSRNRFVEEEEAKAWWFDNGENVCQKYNATASKWARVEGSLLDDPNQDWVWSGPRW